MRTQSVHRTGEYAILLRYGNRGSWDAPASPPRSPAGVQPRRCPLACRPWQAWPNVIVLHAGFACQVNGGKTARQRGRCVAARSLALRPPHALPPSLQGGAPLYPARLPGTAAPAAVPGSAAAGFRAAGNAWATLPARFAPPAAQQCGSQRAACVHNAFGSRWFPRAGH